MAASRGDVDQSCTLQELVISAVPPTKKRPAAMYLKRFEGHVLFSNSQGRNLTAV
jgi:hypothetical protein